MASTEADSSVGGSLATDVDERPVGRSGGPAGQRVDRRLLRESAAARPHLAAAAGLGVGSALLIVAQAALLAQVITAVAMHGASLADERDALIALAAVLVARAITGGLFEFSGRVAAARVLAELRGRLVRQLLLVRPGRAPGERTGELAAVAVQGVDALEDYFAGYLPALMLTVTVPIAVMIWVIPLDPIAAAIFAITMPLLIVFMILIGLRAQSRTLRRWQALSLLSSHFLDVVRGLETLRAHSRERAQAQTLAAVGERYRAETMGTLRLAFISAFALELCAMLGTGLVAATIGVQLTGGHLELDAGLTVLLLAPELYGPLRSVGQQFHASADGLAAAGRLLDVLDEPGLLSDVEDAESAPVPDPRQAPLRFERVSFAYPERDVQVLHDLDLTLAPGEFIAVTGPSGAGKSTLAALALRLADPASGRVRCGPVDLRTVTPERWRELAAWVPQRSRLFAGTLSENIALTRPDASPAQITDAAARAGLTELLEALPEGLATRVGDGGRRLSAGQAQRVALARAFLADAALVVLDEPTANLDDGTAAHIASAIIELARNRTVLLITHDLSLAARADRVVSMLNGRLANSRDLELVA